MVPDERLITSTPCAPWLPDGSTAEAWAGSDCTVPDPSIIVRLLLVRQMAGATEFFCVPTDRGLDLPTLRLGSGAALMTAGQGLALLASRTCDRADAPHHCVGYIRNVVPNPDSAYPHPTPWAHVPVFVPTEAVNPVCDGTWLNPDSARDGLSVRHWWPIVEHHLNAVGGAP